MKSIMQNSKECYICGSRRDLELHHIMHGTANRAKSTEHGLVCWLCAPHHRTSSEAVHMCRQIDLALIRDAQRWFEKEHGHEMWMQEFGKNYLEE